MSNPLYQQMMNGSTNNLMQRVQQLKQTIGGDPMQYIQKLLNSGRIKQSDYDRAVKSASELMKMFGR